MRRCSGKTCSGQALHLGGGGAVDVGILGEGLEQARVAGQVRHDAQLDLRIVGRDDDVSRARR
jgi:hypothetical protein